MDRMNSHGTGLEWEVVTVLPEPDPKIIIISYSYIGFIFFR